MRKWTETIKPWSQLNSNTLYKLRVIDIKRINDPKAMEVDVEFTEQPQLGRRITFLLSLPIRPSGPTAEFFISCHMQIESQGTVSPQDTIGSIISVRFQEQPGDAMPKPVSFEPIFQGEEND